MDQKVIPISRGRPPRLHIDVSQGPASMGFRLQHWPEARGSVRTPQGPGKLLLFNPQFEKGNQNVNRYRIGEDNPVHLVRGTSRVNDTPAFTTAAELAELAASWPLRRLVEVWNGLPGVRAVARFENRKVAVQRIWHALEAQAAASRQQQPVTESRRAERQTKLHVMLRMLREPAGATLADLRTATGWQAHSVRGFLSRKIAKDLSLPVESFRRDGQRVYRLPAAQ